LAPVV